MLRHYCIILQAVQVVITESVDKIIVEIFENRNK